MTPWGRPPSVIRFVTAPVTGSTRASVPSTSSETHTAFGVTASPFGAAPTGNRSDSVFVFGSMRETVPARLFATQTLPAP